MNAVAMAQRHEGTIFIDLTEDGMRHAAMV